jgi:ATP synthase protein I
MMSEEPPTSSLKELDAKLKAARGHHSANDQKNDESKAEADNGLGIALKVGVEFVSAVGVGVAIGLLLDFWLETKPWLMLVFFILGSAAGFLNIFRVMSGFGYAAGYDAKSLEKKSDRPEGE